MIKQLQELIAHGLNPSAEVRAFDGDSGKMELVSGFLHDANQVDLCTDSDDESGPSLPSEPHDITCISLSSRGKEDCNCSAKAKTALPSEGTRATDQAQRHAFPFNSQRCDEMVHERRPGTDMCYCGKESFAGAASPAEGPTPTNSGTFGELPQSIRDAEIVEPHEWDNMNVRAQRDWLLSKLDAMLAGLKPSPRCREFVSLLWKTASQWDLDEVSDREQMIAMLEAQFFTPSAGEPQPHGKETK
jgi:hypothetical protein